MDPRIAPRTGPRPQPARQRLESPVTVGAGSAPVVDEPTTDPIGVPVQPAAAWNAAIPDQRAVLPPAEQQPAAAAPLPVSPVPVSPAAGVGRRRARWMWILLVVALLAAAAYAGWAALGRGPAVAEGTAVQRVQTGQAADSASGLTFTISAPQQYQPNNSLLLDKGDTAYEATLTIVNDSGDVAPASGVALTASVGGTPAPQIFDQSFLSTQQIAVGRTLAVPFRFRVAQGVSGPLQITVTESGVPTVTVSGGL